MKDSAISLTVAPGKDGTAKGYLYMDDGETVNYTKGESSTIKYTFKENKLTTKVLTEGYKSSANHYDKIIILGVNKNPRNVSLELSGTAQKRTVAKTEFDRSKATLTVFLDDKQTKIFDEFTLCMDH